MKDIHRIIIDKTSTINTSPIDYDKHDVYYKTSSFQLLTGNYWLTTEYDSFVRMLGK